MEKCLYIRNLKQFEQALDSIDYKINTVFCGDYGCPKVLPMLKELLTFTNKMALKNMKVHYISPKVTQSMIDGEKSRVLEIIEHGIGVSINDWGLLYSLRSQIKPHHDVYLGRLLTKSIADWVWSYIFFERESTEAIDYLSQNSFNHNKKVNYFKSWGIKGLEVNIHRNGEPSYSNIQKRGFSIIGYADNTIAAVSRACPFLKLEGMAFGSEDCTGICSEKHIVVPTGENEQNVYPEMELCGNVIYLKKDDEPSWLGYDKLVYSWC